MNWEAIGAIGDIAGAATVVATLFFVAGQIRQSNRIARANAEQEWYSKWHDLVGSLWPSPKEAAAFRKGLHGYASLDADEKAVFSGRLVALLDHLDTLRYLQAAGMVGEEFAAVPTRTCQAFINTPGGAQWWADVGPVMGIYDYLEALPRSHVRPMTEALSFLSE